jgi:hypothetical protein
MFRPIWPPPGVRIYLMGKLLLSVVAAITCVGPQMRACVVVRAFCFFLLSSSLLLLSVVIAITCVGPQMRACVVVRASCFFLLSSSLQQRRTQHNPRDLYM